MKNTQFFPGLDGLKAFFCIGIVIYHLGSMFNYAFSQWLDPVYKYGGYFGNYIFFSISGFLIAMKYKTKIAEKACSFNAFMAKHLSTIYPIYFLSNLSMIFLGSSPVTIKRTISTFLILSNGWFSGTDTPYNFPAWFLCVLLICYCLYFGVVTISRNRTRLYFPLCVIFVAWGMVLVKCGWNIPLNYRTCGEGYLNFFLGALTAELYMQKKGTAKAAVISFLVLSVTALCVCLFGFEKLPGDMRWWISAICANLVYLAAYGGFATKFLSFFPLQVIGKHSRSVFLWHIPVARVFLKYNIGISNPSVGFCAYFFALFSFISLGKLISDHHH